MRPLEHARLPTESYRQGPAFFKDRLALTIGFIGLGLAVPTMLWRINPVEGGVMPSFITQPSLGWVFFAILLVTSVPTWFAVMPFVLVLPSAHCPFAFVLTQGCVYFLLGKAISAVRRWRAKRTSAET